MLNLLRDAFPQCIRSELGYPTGRPKIVKGTDPLTPTSRILPREVGLAILLEGQDLSRYFFRLLNLSSDERVAVGELRVTGMDIP